MVLSHSTKKIYVFIAASFLAINFGLLAQQGNDHNRDGLQLVQFGQAANPLLQRMKVIQAIEGQIERIRIAQVAGQQGAQEAAAEAMENHLQPIVNGLPVAAQDGARRVIDAAIRNAAGAAVHEIAARNNPRDPDQRHQALIVALEQSRDNLYRRLNPDPYGRAIAMGLAGNNWKAIQDEDIQSPLEGAAVGMLMSGSKVLSKHLESSIEDVVGGTWDGVMHLIKSCFTSARDWFLYDGEHPFDSKTLKAWQGIIDASFKDLERVLKDGLKDSVRGLDTTLRASDQSEPGQEGTEQEAPLKAWDLLAESYIRQFDFLITRIDQHIKYYDENNITYFLAQELKTQLVGVNKLLSKSSTLKELDAYLDSNKTLIPAFRQNISNVLTRLIDSVEPRPVNSTSNTRTTASRDFGGRSEGRFRDDDDFPTSMRNGWV